MRHITSKIIAALLLLGLNGCQTIPAPKPLPFDTSGLKLGGSPFTEQEFVTAGFKVIHFEQSDNEKVRKTGELLGWGTANGMGDLNLNLFAQYTVVQKTSMAK